MIKNLRYDTQRSCTELPRRVRGKVYEIGDEAKARGSFSRDGGCCLVWLPSTPFLARRLAAPVGIRMVHRNTADNWWLRILPGELSARPLEDVWTCDARKNYGGEVHTCHTSWNWGLDFPLSAGFKEAIFGAGSSSKSSFSAVLLSQRLLGVFSAPPLPTGGSSNTFSSYLNCSRFSVT